MKASDNEFPSILLDEQGSDPATPAAGFWRAYMKAGGLYVIDDGGSVTGPLAPSGSFPSGTSFPGGPSSGDRYFRTDLHLDFYYDGTRWVTTTLYTMPVSVQQALDPISASSTKRGPFPHLTMDIWVVDFWAATYVATTNDGSKYWTIALGSTTLSTISNTASTLVIESAAVNAVKPVTDGWIQVDITKVSTPGTLHSEPALSYRLIGT